MIGQSLGSYRIICQLGMGGVFTVYQAYDPDTEQYVALKVMRSEFSKDSETRENSLRRHKIFADRLNHPNIFSVGYQKYCHF